MIKMFGVVFAALLAITSVDASAVEAKAQIGVASGVLDRGVMTSDKTNINFDARFSDVLFQGFFFDVAADTLDVSDTSDNITLRNEIGFGFKHELPFMTFDAGFYRVMNQIRYTNDVNEFRASASVPLTNSINTFVKVGRVFDVDSRDVYIASGINWTVDRLTLTTMVSGYHYTNSTDSVSFNNAEFEAKYALNNNLHAYATYSLAGEDRFGNELDNHTIVGLTYSF